MSTRLEGSRGPKKHHIRHKLCLWCEEVMEIGQRSPAQYDKIKTHRECVASWVHHGIPKSQVVEKPPTYCAYCKKQLVRREKEQRVAWMKRITCDRSCAAKVHLVTSKCRAVYPVKEKQQVITEEQRMHVKRYERGTDEFNKLASYYSQRI